MTKKEIMARIEELKEKEFMLQMADHWGKEDYELSHKYKKEIRELEALL